MNSALFANLLVIAAAPVIEPVAVVETADFEVTPMGRNAAAHLAHRRLPMADRIAAILPATASDGPEEYEPSPYDGSYSED